MYTSQTEGEILVCYPFPATSNGSLGVPYRQAMVLTKALVHYFVPLVIISTFYALMARRLFHSAQSLPGQATVTQAQSTRRKANRPSFIQVFEIYCT